MFNRNSSRQFISRCIWILVSYWLMTTAGAEADSQGPASYAHLSRSQWQQDLAELNTDIRRYHINPFWFKNEAGYEQLYQEAENYLAQAKTIDTNLVNGYFERLVAYISDGHSYVVNKAARFGAFSYGLEWFGDDLYIVSVEQDDSMLLGAEVLAFDGMSIAEANKRIASFIPVVNSSGFKFHAKDAYHFAGLVHAAGISKHLDRVELRLKLVDGRKVKKTFGLRNKQNNLIDLRVPQGMAALLYRQQQDKNQWFVYLEKEQAVYLRYALVIEKEVGDINRLVAQLVKFLADHSVQKLIVDVRDNGGGDSYFNASLVNAIANSPSINQRGKLFVLTNHNTFSAAINFAGNMEVKTSALFMGEKVADRATFAGEAGLQARHTLTNSGVTVSLSFSEWSSTYDNDKRDAIGLNIPVSLSMQDFLAGRDPVLQACIDYIPQKNLTKKFDNAYLKWIGRYDYSPDKALKIYAQGDALHLEVTEWIFSSLYPQTKNSFKTDMAGIELKGLPNGDLELIQRGSRNRVLHKLSDNQQKPLELLMAGRFDAAKIAYRKIHHENPQLLSIRGNSLGILASHIRARYGDGKYYDQLRDIAVDLYGEPIASWDAGE